MTSKSRAYRDKRTLEDIVGKIKRNLLKARKKQKKTIKSRIKPM
jgi:hypothetical protein